MTTVHSCRLFWDEDFEGCNDALNAHGYLWIRQLLENEAAPVRTTAMAAAAADTSIVTDVHGEPLESARIAHNRETQRLSSSYCWRIRDCEEMNERSFTNNDVWSDAMASTMSLLTSPCLESFHRKLFWDCDVTAQEKEMYLRLVGRHDGTEEHAV
jgi:hypothetical protein